MFCSFFKVYYSRTVTPFPVSFLWISYCCAFKIKNVLLKQIALFINKGHKLISKLFPNNFENATPCQCEDSYN